MNATNKLQECYEWNSQLKSWYLHYYHLMHAAAIAAIRLKTEQDALRMQVRSALEALEIEAFENETGMLANYWQWKELKRLVSADD